MGDRVEHIQNVLGSTGRLYDLLGLVVDVEGGRPEPIDAVHLRIRSTDSGPRVVTASIKAAGQLSHVSDCWLTDFEKWLDSKWAAATGLSPLAPQAFDNRRRLMDECFARFTASGYVGFQVVRRQGRSEEIVFFSLGDLDA